jgi:hypothetical protein
MKERKQPPLPMKKPRAQAVKAKAISTRVLTQTIERCQHITTLAGLLEQCGQNTQVAPLEPQLIGNAGGMIAAESRAVTKMLQQLEVSSGV